MTHKIKLQEQFCDAVCEGRKTFEVRENDRGYQTGDHIIKWPCFGLKENYVVFAIKEIK